VCESVVTSNRVPKNAKVYFADGKGYGLNEHGFSTDLHGYDAFPLGGVDTSCFCGWPEEIKNQCNIPEAICLEKNLGKNCYYVLGSDTGRVFTQGLINDWTSNGDWTCPENDLSDSWGIVPTNSADNWIKESSTSMMVEVTDLLTFGLAGLRVGNIDSLGPQAKKQGVHPGTRVDKLRSKDGRNVISLKNCERDILHRFNATSVVDEVVDDLFPMAQGIHDSLAVSSCLRFSIEYLRLRVMYMISSNKLRDMALQMDMQLPVVAMWRTRSVFCLLDPNNNGSFQKSCFLTKNILS
jgi:hypothetical protein